jgi:hypothetical protein
LPKDTFVHIKNRTISDLAYMNTVLVEEMGNVKDDIIKDFAETTKLNEYLVELNMLFSS